MKGISFNIFALLVLLNFVFGQTTAATETEKYPLSITKVGLDHKVFNPAASEKVNLNFEINKKTDVRVTIFDRLGQKVYDANMIKADPGIQNITWDGHFDDGRPVCGNVFLYVIEAITDNNEKLVYNPAEETGGIEVKPHEYTFDNTTGKIEYVLPNACMIRLRAGLKDGMFARTIFDWEPRSAGRHVEMWDGKDTTGKIDLLKHPDLNLNLTCYTLPANTIIVTGNTISLASGKKFAGNESTKQDHPWATEGKYLHYGHDPRICHEPRFTVSFPASGKGDNKGTPVVFGVTPIRMELNEQDAWDLTNKRFEIMLFVDGIFLFEMEEGSSPFTFYWDTKGFTKGQHILTANIMSYDDHIGVVSREVAVGE